MPGPIPNREADLARPRSRKGGNQQGVTKGEALPASPYEADPTWHPIAAQLWDACIESGQAAFYQQSDWAILYSLCDDLSMYKKPLTTKDGTEYHKRSGQMLQTIMSALSDLLVTEGARRRVRVELEAPEPPGDDAVVLAIAEYQRELEEDGDD